MDCTTPLTPTTPDAPAPQGADAPAEAMADATAAADQPSGSAEPVGEELEAALARFAAALTRVERAAARAAGRDDAVRVQAMAITRLKRENEQLRAAQEEEARLRDATLEQVDRAMEAVERALQSAAAPTASPQAAWKGEDAYGSAA